MDARLRERQRTTPTLGFESEVAWVAQRARSGELSSSRLRLALRCGSPIAAEVLCEDDRLSRYPMGAWVHSLAEFGRDPLVRVAWTLAENFWFERERQVYDGQLRPVLISIGACALAPERRVLRRTCEERTRSLRWVNSAAGLGIRRAAEAASARRLKRCHRGTVELSRYAAYRSERDLVRQCQEDLAAWALGFKDPIPPRLAALRG